jgi:hypothetical protein
MDFWNTGSQGSHEAIPIFETKVHPFSELRVPYGAGRTMAPYHAHSYSEVSSDSTFLCASFSKALVGQRFEIPYLIRSNAFACQSSDFPSLG